MKKRLMRLAASAGLVGALAIGAIVMIPSEASAAPRCGLSYWFTPTTNRYVKRLNYTIRQCNGYTVKRKINLGLGLFGYRDGPCHTIRAYSTISNSYEVPNNVYVKEEGGGIKEC